MFWGGAQTITGHRYERLRALVTNDVAVYSAHLPLDVHPRLGNNALLARRLGLTPTAGFARYQAIDVGLSGSDEILTRTLAQRAGELDEFAGTLVATPLDPARITRHWGSALVGRDSASVREAASRGLDTLIVGEGPHHTAIEPPSLESSLYAGHYATETLGVRALGTKSPRISGSRRFSSTC
jgi:putative NIF3 family GTP cyclohydrolase 1 type 2